MKRGYGSISNSTLEGLFDGLEDVWKHSFDDIEFNVTELQEECKNSNNKYIEIAEPIPEVVLAAKNNETQRVEELLELEYDLSESYKGNSALNIAFFNENMEMLKILLNSDSHFALMDFYKFNTAGHNMITFAAEKRDIELVEFIYQKCPQCIHVKNAHGKTVLDIAFENNHFFLIRNLLQYGMIAKNSPLLNIVNASGYTLLMLAVDYNDEKIVDLLLTLHADINVKTKMNNLDKTALLLASDRENMPIILKLLQSEVDTEQLNALNIRGNPLIIEAVKNNNIELIELLAEKGADLNIRSHAQNSKTALDCASDSGYMLIIKKLLAWGAGDKRQLNNINDSGNTILMLAVMFDDIDLIEVLYQRGADFNIKGRSDHTGKSAYEIAVEFLYKMNANFFEIQYKASENQEAFKKNLPKIFPVKSFATLSKLIQCGAGSIEELVRPIYLATTVAHFAIMLDDVKLVEELYIRGIPFYRVNDMFSPVAYVKTVLIAKKLLELGERFHRVYVNDDNLYYLIRAIILDDIELFNSLSDHYDIKNMHLNDILFNSRIHSYEMLNPLSMALQYNSMQVANKIIEKFGIHDVVIMQVYKKAFDKLTFLKECGTNIPSLAMSQAITDKDIKKMCTLLELGVDLKNIKNTILHETIKEINAYNTEAYFEIIKVLAYHQSKNDIKYSIQKVNKCPKQNYFENNTIYLYRNSKKHWVFALKTHKLFQNQPLQNFSRALNTIDNVNEEHKIKIFDMIREHVIAEGFIVPNRFISGEYASIKDKSGFAPIQLFKNWRKNNKKSKNQFENFIQYLLQDVKDDAAYYVAHAFLSQKGECFILDHSLSELQKGLNILYDPGLPWEIKEYIWEQARYKAPNTYTVQYTRGSDRTARNLADAIVQRKELKIYDMKVCEDKGFLTQYFPR